MLNAVLARAQRSCCAAMDALVPTRASVAAFEQRLVDMFRHEWRLARSRPTTGRWPASPSSTKHPSSSTSTPSSCCSSNCSSATACARSSPTRRRCEWRDGRLWHGELAIDLVYNRLTDFYLEQPASAALREAYEQQGVVLTPHPQAHALYADKRQLALFSDAARLQALGVPEATRQLLLDHVPHTELVNAADARTSVGGAPRPVLQAGGRLRQPRRVSRRQAHAAGLAGDPGRRLRGAGHRAARRAPDRRRRHRAGDEVRPARLRLRRRGAVGGGAPVPGPDHQLPHAGRRLCAGVQHDRRIGRARCAMSTANMPRMCSCSTRPAACTRSRTRCSWRSPAMRPPRRRWPARPCAWPIGTCG